MLIFVMALFMAINDSSSHPEQEELCVCGRIYSPVCGNDGLSNKTYDNECILECDKRSAQRTGRKLRKVHEGACQTDNENEM